MQTCCDGYTCRQDLKSLQTHLELRFVFLRTPTRHTHTICSMFSFFSETEGPVCHSVTWCPLKSRIVFNFFADNHVIGSCCHSFWTMKSSWTKTQMFLKKVGRTSFFHRAEFCFYCQLNVGLLQSLPVQYFTLNDPPSTNSPGEEVTSRVCLGS